MKVGIDDVSLAAGRRCIDLNALVKHGRHSVTDLSNVGFVRRSVLDIWEDPVTLAAEAARPLIEDPDAIGLMLVGTETGLDYGKPLSSYLHRILKLGPHCRNAEIKHACYGTTMAVRLACSWACQNADRKALVVGTDICRRQNGATAELSAGIGAVAMSVCVAPRVLEVEPISGCAAQETWDVARPTLTYEHGDPILSLYSYLDALEMAWEDLRTSTGIVLDDLRYLLYHCPAISLVRQAHRVLTGGLDDFEDRVEPSLGLNRQLANIYGGSLYASLLGLLESRDVPEGTRIGLFSYGSGACAELWIGRVGCNPLRVRRHKVAARMAARAPCTVEEWLSAEEALEQQLAAADLEIASPGASGQLVLESIRGWHRSYRWT